MSHNIQQRETLFGLDFLNDTLENTSKQIIQFATQKIKTQISFVNAHCFNIARKDKIYYQALKHSEMILPDGSGVNLALKLKGKELINNLNGTDLFPILCKQAAQKNLKIYLLGAKEGIAEKVAENMKKQIPNLIIAGTQHGYFRKEDTKKVIDRINQSGADLVFVAFGVPLQDTFIADYKQDFEAPVLMGVGGLFDFFSNRIPRAPLWMRKTGLEWIYRLKQEPKRMWKRYILGNPLFIRHALANAGKYWISKTLKTADTALKRITDFTGAFAGLTLAFPLFALLAIIIKLESKGPIFFSQKRIGKNGKFFKMYKFRSMYTDAEDRIIALNQKNQHGNKGVTFKMKKDPRITKVGAFIRRFSLDELPQLFNILVGDMSIVGPRPALPREVARYNPKSTGRLKGKPGLTCLWQISGRANIPFEKQVEMDIQYLENRSFIKDLKIIILTAPAVLSGKGAY